MEEHRCEKCETLFLRPIHGYKKKFCSRKCSNSREFSIESNKKKSSSMRNHWNNLSVEDRNKKKSLDSIEKRKNTYLENIFKLPFDDLKYGTKRRRVLIEQNNRCLHCGINEWNGSKITLELDHINGNTKDNSRNNLRFLCPNCHSLTPTWRGRNNNKPVTV